MIFLKFFTHFLLILSLGFYLITTLQWFSYKFERVFFHFTKPLWHLIFLFIPICCYFGLRLINENLFFIYFYIILLPSLIFWHKKLDKKLVFTSRVKRFFLILILTTLFLDIILFKKAFVLPIFAPLFLSFFISFCFEKLNAKIYMQKAQKKLESMPNLTIIQITASYGKTSIKNFLYQILNEKFNCYKTPRSVNTLMGLVKDINENLNTDVQIYIAEAGARKNGDIDEITKFLKPQIVVVGEIGSQHIEYFKSVDNIRKTKLEALNSARLKKAFLHSSTLKKDDDKIVIYDDCLQNIKANLNGVSFEMKFDESYKFYAPILGSFNASNLAVCICVAKFLGLKIDEIKLKISNLKSVEHRLQIVSKTPKFIIDDGFNGNFEGMSASYELVREYGRNKVIVTPGIVEATKQMNENLAKIINEIFDLIIVTGELNAKIFSEICDKNKLIILKDKNDLIKALSEKTKAGDLILFSNDAPNFI